MIKGVMRPPKRKRKGKQAKTKGKEVTTANRGTSTIIDSNFDLLIYSEVGTMKPGDYMIHVTCSLN